MLEHDVRRNGSVYILDLAGRISSTDALASDPSGGVTLHEILVRLLEQGAQHIVVNLKDVSYIDSSGIGVLFGLYTTLKKSGGRLVLLNPNARLRDIMKLTRLDTLIEIGNNEADVVQSLARAAGH